MNAPISNKDVAKIAKEVNNWKDLSPFLDLTPQQETEIERSCGADYGEQKRAALLKWRDAKGKEATYAALIAAAREAGSANLAEYVRSLATATDGERKTNGGAGGGRELTTDDMISVTTHLTPLSKEQVKTLGMLLGLSDTTVRNSYEGSSARIYLDSILTAWFRKQDKVIEKGGPRWSVLVKALQHGLLGQNGIAENIRTKELS